MSRPPEHSSSNVRSGTSGVTARGTGYLFGYVVAGTAASVVAVVTGTILASLYSSGLDLLTANFGVVLMFAFLVLFSTFLAGFIWTMPTTFVLFPLWIAAFRGRPALCSAGLFPLGMAAGGATMWLLWFSNGRYVAGESGLQPILAGAIAGLMAAIVYRRMARMIVG